MAYATIADVEKILPEDVDRPEVDSRDEANLLAALDETTDLVIGYMEREYTGGPTDPEGDPPDIMPDLVPNDVPGAVRRVVARSAMRVFMDDPDNPGAESEISLMGPFNHTLNWSRDSQSRTPYLTGTEKLRLDRFKAGTRGQVGHFPMATARDC